jgi:tape measure domain-containing protein|nr:MAG TPA: tail tape measure protein [Caudoviricetes sp.]
MAYFDLQIFAADGHLNFDTKIDEKGFSGGIKKLGSIAKGGLSILGGAIAGVTGAMGAGITAGMKYNADMQMYMANFSTMLGSEESAVKFVDQLKETAAKTPFEMSDLSNASKTLLAFGSTADNANDQIKMLGDISLGNAEKLKTLSTAFGRIQSNGKASMEEINMMIDSGFNPLNIIAGKTGETMEQVRDRVSKGKVSFEELNGAMVQATSEGGQFYKGMEKASTTMDGLISTLKDNAMALLGEVVQPLTDTMTNTLLPQAIDTIDQLSNAFKEGGVDQLLDVVSDIAANLALGIAQQLPMIIETGIGILVGFIEALNANLPMFMKAGASLLEAIANGLMILIPALLSLSWSIVSGLISGLLSYSGKLREQGAKLLDLVINGITTTLPNLVSKGGEVCGEFVEGVLSNLPAVISAGGDIINRLLEAVLTAYPKLIESGAKLVSKLAKGILNNLPAVLTSIASVLAQLLATIGSHLPEILQQGIELIGKLAVGLIKGIPVLISKIPEIIESIKNVFSKFDWKKIGKDIVDGIANGLKNAVGAVVDAAKEVGESALNGLKNLLGIHSPSRVFRDEVGRNIALGIAEGIKRNKKYAKSSAEEIAQAVLDSAKKRLDNYKVYNNLTLAEEAAYWDEARKQVKEGTQAKIDADKEYFTAKKELENQMLQAEEKYTDNVAKAYDELNDKILDLNKQYEDAVSQRADEIKSAFGLFDEFSMDTELSSDDLLNNLQSQVDGLRQWRSNLDELSDRGIGKELLEELQNLGPKAAAEIQLLTEMSDDELDEYVGLFKAKNRLARKQAVEELEPMRQDIAAQITKMQQETSAELAKYQQEYMTSMLELGVSLNQPLEIMKLTAVQNAVELVSAMAGSVKEASGTTENMDKFKAIAQNVLGAVQTLPTDMTQLGKDAINGMIDGIKAMSGNLYTAMSDVVGNAMRSAIDAVTAGNAVDAALAGTGYVTGTAAIPASSYGNEGYGPGYAIDYKRMGLEMGRAMEQTGVYMDNKKVGNLVSEPVNENLGNASKTEERGVM